MKSREWGLHISIVAWLFILGNAIYLVLGAMGLIFLTGVGLAFEDAETLRILTTVGGIGAIFFTILAVPGLIAGVGLLKRKPWARILAVVLAVLGLMNFPIGTAVGIYTLWVLLQTEACECFPAAKVA